MGEMTSVTKWLLTLAGVFAALGLVAKCVGSPYSVWLNLLEPWLLAGLAALIGSLLLENQFRIAAAVGSMVVGGSLLLRAPVNIATPDVDRPRHLRALKGCAVLAKEPTGPIRLAVWTIDYGGAVQRGLDAILDLQPDIVVLRGTDRPGVAMRLQEALNGEAKVSATRTGGLIAATRGNFQYCGGEEDQWTFDLPAWDGRNSSGVVSFPYVEDIGVVPLMLGQVEGPEGVFDFLDWPVRVHQGASTMAVAAEFVGGSNLVMVADFFAPPASPSLALPLTGAGLSWATSAPNWPHRVGAIPSMGQHPLDQVWVGPNWSVQNTRVLDDSEHQRAPLIVDLVAHGSRAGRL